MISPTDPIIPASTRDHGVDVSDPPFIPPAHSVCPTCNGSGWTYPQSDKLLSLVEIWRGRRKCADCKGTGDKP